jgi:hypothetical protein
LKNCIPIRSFILHPLETKGKVVLLSLFILFQFKLSAQNTSDLFFQIDTLHSPIAKHLNYHYFYNNLPVYNAFKQEHLFKSTPTQLEQSNFPAHLTVNTSAHYHNAYLLQQDTLVPVIYEMSNHSQFWYSTELDLLQTMPIGNNYKDTFATVKVFAPNPINSSGQLYNRPFKDNQDQHAAYFNKEYRRTPLPLYYNTTNKNYQPIGKFILKEISPPYLPATNWLALTDTLNRSHPAFEDANALYHLHLCDSFVTALGYGLLSDTLYIDTHALNGADQSIFKGVQRPASIEFGTGGVDDAEDGEVIAHEYAHSLSARATHAAPAGVERNCIEEGWADYFAKRYSRTFTTNPPNNLIFSWDAHNEFWEGYFINTQQQYATDVLNANSTCRQVWSTALHCIYEKLGTYADTLFFELLFYQHDNITMPELAEWLIKIDSLYASAAHYAALKSCFAATGILKKDQRDLVFEDKTAPKLLNSYGFTHAGEALVLQFSQTKLVDMGLYDAQGKLVVERLKQIGQVFSIAAENASPGLYYFRVYSHTDNRFFTFKLGKGD